MIDPTHAENTLRRTSSYLRVTSLLETVAFKRTDWVTVWVTENIFNISKRVWRCVSFQRNKWSSKELIFLHIFFSLLFCPFIFRVPRAKILKLHRPRVSFSRSNFRPKFRLQKRLLKRAFNDSFQKTFTPLFAIRENNDDGATTTTVFFPFLPSESTTTKTVRHRTRGSDSRLPVRLLRTGTHTLSLNSLFNSLSLSPFYRTRVKAWCAVVVLVVVLDVCIYLYARRSAR